MPQERHIKLSHNGRDQMVQIPEGFELDADEVIVRRENDRLVIEPVRRRGLLATLARLEDLEEEFPDVDAGLQPPEAVEL